MKKICFIAQFPPPMHGLSKAVQTLFDANSKNNDLIFEKIDIKNNRLFFITIFKILKNDADLFYFTISQTPGGNIRDLIILYLLNVKKKRYIIHLHGGNYYREMIDNNISKFQKKLNYKYIGNAERVIVLSESLKKTFKEMIDENKIVVVANCIDDEFMLDKEEFIQKNKKMNNKQIKNILYLSNFIKEKGFEHVLQLAKLEKEYFNSNGTRNFNFYFAGKFFSKKEEREFTKYIDDNELNDYITYKGVVNGKEKKDLLKESDIFVLLTTYFREGQPISIIEAMGNGLVIVSTEHAAIPDMIQNNINGILINKNSINASEIYNKLLKLNYEEISNNNYDNSFKYSEEKYLKSMYKCFQECLYNLE